jgi:glycosyltransferase involved in cell wall biosynthesis
MTSREEQSQVPNPKKIAIVTHSISHFEVPLYRVISSCSELELKVFYTDETGIREKFDPLYNRPIQWGIPVLEGYFGQLLKSPIEIIKVLRREKFDAVIVYGYADWLKMLAILSCRLSGIPLIFRGTATLLEQRNPLKQAIKKIGLNILFRLFSAFLVGGSYNRDYFRYFGVKDEAMFFVPFSVDVQWFATEVEKLSDQKQVLKRRYGIDAEVVILFVGNLTPKKGPHILLPAFRVLAQEVDGVMLVMAGDGPMMQELKRYVKEAGLDNKVLFLGFVSQKELPNLYVISDVVVFPSLYDETWARAVNEAMACKLPIIASRKVGATGDIVRDGINGFVVKEGDIEELADKMRLLVTDRELRKRMGEASKEIIKDWTYEAALPNVIQAVEYAIAARKRKIAG